MIADLPTTLGAPVTTPQPLLIEWIGPATTPDAAVTSHVNLLGLDRHSLANAPLLNQSRGAPVRSYERWMQLRLVSDGDIRDLAFWLPNYTPDASWTLAVGTTATYQTPSNARSYAAVHTPATSAPGLPIPLTQDPFGWTSDFVVLQATWTGEALADDAPVVSLQPDPLQFAFSWLYT